MEIGDTDGVTDLIVSTPYSYQGRSAGTGLGGRLTDEVNFGQKDHYAIGPMDNGNATKLAYFTPDLSGFSVSVAYTPNLGTEKNQSGPKTRPLYTNRDAATAFGGSSNTDSANMLSTLSNGAGHGLAAVTLTNINGAFSEDTLMLSKSQYKTGLQASASIEKQVGDSVTLQGSLYGMTAQPKKLAAGEQTVLQGMYKYKDIMSVGAGASVGYKGFTLGLASGYHGKSRQLTGPGLRSDGNSYSYGVGAQYEFGPWTVGYAYGYNRMARPKSSVVLHNNMHTNQHSIGGKYALAPGLFLYSEGLIFSMREQVTQINTTGAAAGSVSSDKTQRPLTMVLPLSWEQA